MQKKKKILLVGSLASIHMYNYILNVLSTLDFDIVAYNTASNQNIRAEYQALYNKLGIKNIGGCDIRSGGKLSFVTNAYKVLKAEGRFDYVHLHYVSHYLSPILYLLRRNYKKIILTFWGSDLLRSTSFSRLFIAPLVKKANKVSFITNDMFDSFKVLFPKCESNDEKYCILDFGNMFFNAIDKIQSEDISNVNEIRKEFGLDDDKVVVTIGYCGRKEMRQLETIREVGKCLPEVLSSIQLAVPAWGISTTLKNDIIEESKKIGVKCCIYDEFMNGDTVSKFRCISDVFIHAQTTDALSAAMLEHLYAGTVVLNGAWLNYNTLRAAGVEYLTFDTISSVANELDRVILSLPKYKLMMQNNKKCVAKIASWDYLKQKWYDLY